MKHHEITYQSVPRETFSAVDELLEKHRSQVKVYINQLLWWNKRINLVSRDVPRETILEHIRHSLLLTQFGCFKNSSTIVDSGTGGGLPGIPLAIASSEKTFILNDIVSKKMMAVKQIVQKIKLKNVTTKDKTVAELQVESPFLLISKHAFKIDDLYRLTSHLPWAEMVFYKGIDFENELEIFGTPLSIVAYNLYENSNQVFYKDKVIVVVSRQDH